MIRADEKVFVDTGAWVALAVVPDPLHEQAREQWELTTRSGAKVLTSVPVVIETFAYLDHKGSRTLALRWRDSLKSISRFSIAGCSTTDLERAWGYLERKDLHKLSFTDATSFSLMHKHGIKIAFAFRGPAGNPIFKERQRGMIRVPQSGRCTARPAGKFPAVRVLLSRQARIGDRSPSYPVMSRLLPPCSKPD